MAARRASSSVPVLGTTASAAARYSGRRWASMVRSASMLEESGRLPPTASASTGRSINSTTPFWCRARRFSGRFTTPPPQDSSWRFSLPKRAVCSVSFARKPSSPSAAKMSGMLRPSALTIAS